MRLLLIISILVASLSFTGVVKAADFCLHDCQQETGVLHDNPLDSSKKSHHECAVCCMQHCGYTLPSLKSMPPVAADLQKFRPVDVPIMPGHEPSGLLRPPKTA